MISQLLVMSATFAAISTGLLAVGMFLRDMIYGGRVDTARRRLELAPEAPTGSIDLSLFRLVEESGVSFDVTTASALILGGAIVGGGIPFAFFEDLLLAAGGAVVGAFMPVLYLMIKRWFRVGNMRKNLPVALQAIADAIRSGQTLEEACQMAAEDVPGPLGEEFAYAQTQMELGHSPVSVMNRMAVRVPLHEFRVFATAVAVHRRAGGNLSLLTERMALVARDRQDIRSHLMAATSGSRLSAIGMALGSVVAVGALLWLEPEYVQQFFTHPRGPMILAAAGFLELLGCLWVWRILRVGY